jgi:UV DNA damage endonuclease
MKLRNIGYACINRSIDLTTGHTLRLANLDDETVAGVIAKNLANLGDILEWNVEHGIRFFRVSSSVIPFASHPEFTLRWRDRFSEELAAIRNMVRDLDCRLSMHPGQYTVLNSNKPDVAERAVDELNYHAAFLEAVTPDGGDIVLHVGGAYGDKPRSMQRFADNFDTLSEAAQSQLIVENDDTVYTLDEVLALCQQIERPLVFDIFHHQCNHERDHWRDGLVGRLEAVVGTWRGRAPKCHISTQREGTRISHADYISEHDFQTFVDIMNQVDDDAPFDLMVEAKNKDEAVLRLLEKRRS